MVALISQPNCSYLLQHFFTRTAAKPREQDLTEDFDVDGATGKLLLEQVEKVTFNVNIVPSLASFVTASDQQNELTPTEFVLHVDKFLHATSFLGEVN